ncbi:MAG: hypothetical protein R2715_15105 [Ilumatobacteraceae bacterium]
MLRVAISSMSCPFCSTDDEVVALSPYGTAAELEGQAALELGGAA